MSETSSTLPTFSCNSANTCNTVESAFLLNPTKPIARLVLVLTAGAVGILWYFTSFHVLPHWLLLAHPSPAVASCHWPQLASPCSWPKQPKHPKLRHQKCLKKCWWDVGQNFQTLWASLSNKWLTICLPWASNLGVQYMMTNPSTWNAPQSTKIGLENVGNSPLPAASEKVKRLHEIRRTPSPVWSQGWLRSNRNGESTSLLSRWLIDTNDCKCIIYRVYMHLNAHVCQIWIDWIDMNRYDQIMSLSA